MPENVQEAVVESRTANLKTAEDSLRSILKKLMYQEELSHLKSKLDTLKAMQTDPDEDAIGLLDEELQEAYKRHELTEAQVAFYHNTEEEMCEADRRSQRLDMILRVRAVLGSILEGQGLLLESFYVQR